MSNHGLDLLAGLRPTKACVNCRKQKMRCEVEGDGPVCKRCKASKTECIFRPRANAAALKELNKPNAAITRVINRSAWTDEDRESILSRLDAIEAFLGLESSQQESERSPLARGSPEKTTDQQNDEEPAFSGVWAAATYLKSITRQNLNPEIWTKSKIKALWLFFHTNTPGLHFLSKNRTSPTPTPLLLGAILHVAALHHTSADMAALAPDYFIATCNAIAELSVYPVLTPKRDQFAALDTDPEAADKVERTAFENVLGILLASLISEGFIEATGIWISIGYRLTLDHCPVRVDHMSREWGGIFSGLQIIDLEHASLHLSCPTVPIESPLASLSQLQQSSPDPFYPLTQMMHAGLSRFTGRGLPSIWSYIVSKDTASVLTATLNFTEEDGKVMRAWAARLDQWLVEYNRPSNPVNDNIVIFRQYSLHRLFVLSIYLPARGFDIFANNVASVERHELLVSARTVLKLQSHDKGIWSNWDLVMITWAALLILQAVEGGSGEPDDFETIQSHLNLLQGTHQPEPSLRHHLSNRLVSALQSMHTPPATTDDMNVPAESDPSWMIFDENSIKVASEQLFAKRTQNSGPSVAQAPSGPSAEGLVSPYYDDYLGIDAPSEVWSGTLMRVFGNTEFAPGNDNLM